MPRRKKIDNELENLHPSEVDAIRDLEIDDIVINELSEEDAAAANELLKEMDERKRISATRRKKRELYRSDNFSDFDDDFSDLVTEEDMRYETYQKLNQSLISGSILCGEVVKCLRRMPESQDIPTAICKMENDDYFEIKIPFTDFLPKTSISDLRGDTAADKLNYMDLLINMRTGAKIHFVVRKLDETTGEVIASRTMAMTKMMRDGWFSRDRAGRFDRAWVGRDIPGRVTYVTRTQIGVETMGIEKVLDISDLSWQRYSDIRTAPLKIEKKPGGGTVIRPYTVGDSILLKITGLKRTFRDEEGTVYDELELPENKRVRPDGLAVKLSAKEVTENPDKKYFNKLLHDYHIQI